MLAEFRLLVYCLRVPLRSFFCVLVSGGTRSEVVVVLAERGLGDSSPLEPSPRNDLLLCRVVRLNSLFFSLPTPCLSLSLSPDEYSRCRMSGEHSRAAVTTTTANTLQTL